MSKSIQISIAGASTQHKLLYEFTVTPVVKKYKGQQANKAVSFDDFTVMCSSVDHLKVVLWEQFGAEYTTHLVRIDTTEDAETTYSYKDEEPTVNDIHHFMMLYRNKKYFTFSINALDQNAQLVTNKQLQLFNAAEQNIPIQSIICKYTHSINSAVLFSEFDTQVLRAQDLDRAGAVAENAIQNIIQQRKEAHARHYNGQDIQWRLWATHIAVKVPIHQQMEAINGNPPGRMIEFFSPVMTDSAQHLRQLQVSANLTLDILEQELLDVDNYLESLEIMFSRARAHRLLLVQQMRMTSQFVNAAVPKEPANARIALDRIPNQADLEHSDILQ